MTVRKRRWLIAGAATAAMAVVAVFIAASVLARRFEPFLRQQAIAYMEQRFNADVEIKDLRVRMPKASPLRLLFTGGRGAVAGVEGDAIAMRMRGSSMPVPLFSIQHFRFDVDLGTLRDTHIIVPHITLEGVEVNIPPKGDRPKIPSPQEPSKAPSVLIQNVRMTDTKLAILPRDPKKVPLEFQIHNLRFESVGAGRAMSYQAALTNPKPPGTIDSHGSFGPWNTEEPADTPLEGRYTFEKADLGIFRAIAGTLDSTGEFKGVLSSIEARGEARVPNFRLKMSGNPVPLRTDFEVLVDGTNGNTVLKPVRAVLGRTRFTTSGGVIKHEGDVRRSIQLDVDMPNGDIQDLLRLATKGAPFMAGQVKLKTRIDIPPLSGRVQEKLLLDGTFQLANARFLRSTIQDQIDSLSRRGQGQPKNEGIDQVVSNMKGAFRLANEIITFRNLSFGVPGALVNLTGDYNIDDDVLDFRGALKLDAKVSQTMTGWKRWALKPVDPFFSKHGAGTYLPIKVVGTSRDPQFGTNFRDNREGTRARKSSRP